MKTRIIAKLDVKSEFVVKPVHFEGLRKIGSPAELAKKYYKAGVDEIFFIDIVASLYQREIRYKEIAESAKDILVPFAVGGGVRTIDDFSKLFHNGADKVVVNTHALQNSPEIIDNAVKIFGSQAVVVNIEAKKWDNYWECYTDCGRIQTGKSVLNWVKEVENRGAGEILIQSVDCDGRKRGFDIELIKSVVDFVNIPVVAGSGAGCLDDILKMRTICKPSGISISSLLHYNELTVSDIKEALKNEC